MVNRRVERSYIDQFIENNGPDGLLEYAKAARVSSSTIAKARIGFVPKKRITREAMAGPLGIDEDQLFPVLQDGKDEAS
jgi:hypothetical protein